MKRNCSVLFVGVPNSYASQLVPSQLQATAQNPGRDLKSKKAVAHTCSRSQKLSLIIFINPW